MQLKIMNGSNKKIESDKKKNHIIKNQPLLQINEKPDSETNVNPVTHKESILIEANQLERINYGGHFGTNKASQATLISPTNNRLKLRDYLYLAQTSAKKAALSKKDVTNHISSQTPKISKQNNMSPNLLTKNKYSMNQNEMFGIIKKQIQSDMLLVFQQLQEFKKFMDEKQQSGKQMSHEQMIYIYKLRRLIKDNLLGCIKEVKQTTKKITQNDSLDRVDEQQESFKSNKFFKKKTANTTSMQCLH